MMEKENIIYDGIVINASKELVPTIRIAPLDIPTMTQCNEKVDWQKVLHTGRYVSIHKKARYAITAALEDLQLRRDDVVTIQTTSGNFYVSRCVTRAIEAVCQWNREVTNETKAILVIHEFGYPYKGLSELKKYRLPIIEDCAYAYFTKGEEIGQVGDYVIYSLTKAFNMPIGGVMVSKNKVEDKVSGEERDYILSYWATEYKKDREIIKKRLANYVYIAEELASLGIAPFFKLTEGVVPGAFLFRWRDNIDYPDLKEYMQRNGVESSVFYKEHAYYIPLHQNLSMNELDYMIKLLKYYQEAELNKNNV